MENSCPRTTHQSLTGNRCLEDWSIAAAGKRCSERVHNRQRVQARILPGSKRVPDSKPGHHRQGRRKQAPAHN